MMQLLAKKPSQKIIDQIESKYQKNMLNKDYSLKNTTKQKTPIKKEYQCTNLLQMTMKDKLQQFTNKNINIVPVTCQNSIPDKFRIENQNMYNLKFIYSSEGTPSEDDVQNARQENYIQKIQNKPPHIQKRIDDNLCIGLQSVRLYIDDIIEDDIE